MAGAHRFSGLRGLRGRRLGQDASTPSFDWTNFLDTTITTAGAVAAKAVTPPTYSSVVNPLQGTQTITELCATFNKPVAY